MITHLNVRTILISEEFRAILSVLLFSILLGLLARRVLLGRLARLADTTTFKAYDAIIASLRRPLPIWFLLGGLYVALRFVRGCPKVS